MSWVDNWLRRRLY